MKVKSQGWVILSADKKTIYEFTFCQVRTDAQRKWTRLWTRPDNWKSHYNRGVRCVKAERTIILNLTK